MSWRCLPVVSCVAAALLGAPAVASARPPITGKLSKPGYTVIALTSTGRAAAVKTRSGTFRLRPPASKVTLHLRGPNGVYAGPLVIGSDQHGRHAIVGVKAGARLGEVTVSTRRGYAKAARRVAKRWVDTSRWARARKGVPIGAGKFGRVRSKPPHASPPGDRDADGVPDRLDIDLNGNLILDRVDRSISGRARAAQTESPFFIGADLGGVPQWDIVNANAGTVTDAEIDRVLSSYETLAIGILPGSPELDCGGAPDPNTPQGWIGGLSYCTRGGTGEAPVAGTGGAQKTFLPFPACCDADGDGWGTLINNSLNPPPGALSLTPRATSSQIGTGDVLIQRVTSNGVTTDTPTVLPYIFDTVVALVSYDDGQGNTTRINYPVAVDPALGTPGSGTNPFRVAAGPDGHVALKLTFWRPQRRPIPPEPGDWTDVGKLSYTANVQSVGTTAIPGQRRDCPQSAFSENDPNVSAPQTFNASTGTGGVTDLAPDQPANPGNTISYTLDLTTCLASLGVGWNPGESAVVHFAAVDGFASSVTQTDTWAVFERR